MTTMDLAVTPDPPYYAVIFSSLLSPHDQGYAEAATRMMDLVQSSPGFLAVDSARGDDRLGITVAYFRDEESIRAWRDHVEHTTTRERGRAQWYDAYELRVAKVERAYGFRRAPADIRP
ncbi:antibiotic biosynthesis monooxygenase [Actinokineospora sp. NBRC 105648]|uniref:antibiotic biosynthesis monooxygenase family protein n=1 Tax=Actinokineospora sp. NBRC 105648 TaxID=3032206 RepID=UPI0024A522C9|nr:antibiotic biosynthesis monooxygenase [Actinokineospora sp. NBRC 105648]GLZ41902.1 polysaccharide biosynthesis protein [Actinokineospora sp. NBRC 105648]